MFFSSFRAQRQLELEQFQAHLPVAIRDRVVVDGRAPDYYEGPYIEDISEERSKKAASELAELIRRARAVPRTLEEEVGPLPPGFGE